jgi:diphosphomevalonate decarboxylase
MTAATSDLQAARVMGATKRLEACKAAMRARDFAAFAEVVELDSNLMHAVMMTSRPPLFYWLPPTLAIMERIHLWRSEGLRVCYTLDAGPNVHCICVQNDAEQVRSGLAALSDVIQVRVAAAGSAARLVNN